jgi:DNA (cytosine-5)-methyltransferase 1
VRRPTPLECERLQGLPDNWSAPAPSQVTPIDRYDTERYKAVGNAVAIPVVEWVAERIRANFKTRPPLAQQLDALPVVPAEKSTLRALAAEFGRPDAQVQSLRVAGQVKWQRSGCAVGDTVLHAPASTAPVKPVESRFVDLIEQGRVDERYFLSPNAARGIIRRIERAGRHLFPPLEATLRSMANGRVPAPINVDEDALKIQEAAYG